MSTTIKDLESIKIKKYIIRKFCDYAYKLARSGKYGVYVPDGELYKLKKLFLYMIAIDSWKQDRYSYLRFSNYINDYMVRSLYNKAKEVK